MDMEMEMEMGKKKCPREFCVCLRYWRINLRLWFNTRFCAEFTSLNPLFRNSPAALYPNRAISIPSNEFFDSGREIYVCMYEYVNIYGCSVCLCAFDAYNFIAHFAHCQRPKSDPFSFCRFVVLLFTILFLPFSMTLRCYNLRKMAGSNFRGFFSNQTAHAFLYIFNLIILCHRNGEQTRETVRKSGRVKCAKKKKKCAIAICIKMCIAAAAILPRAPSLFPPFFSSCAISNACEMQHKNCFGVILI